jgi:hypothetical protein
MSYLTDLGMVLAKEQLRLLAIDAELRTTFHAVEVVDEPSAEMKLSLAMQILDNNDEMDVIGQKIAIILELIKHANEC